MQRKIRNLQRNLAADDSSYRVMESDMSLKLHFLHSLLNSFPEEMGTVSEEHGEGFHQDIYQKGKTYSGKWSPNMLTDYRWRFIRQTPNGEYKRQQKKN